MLTMPVISQILRDLKLPVEPMPHGFVLQSFYPITRLERGSGIAGRGDHWHIVEHGTHGYATESVSTRKELRRLLREWAAGPKPDGARYARMNHNRFGDSYVWSY